MNTTLKNHKHSNPLTKKTLEKRIILCNFVYLKSPKTSPQMRYSNQEFYTQNCVKVCNFCTKCIPKQSKTIKEIAIQSVYTVEQ